jgi:DNA-binding PadR family transcriptional regulator
MYSKEIIKGTLKPIILQLLKNDGEMYGYEITQKVKELTDGKIKITEGALYPLLHKLEGEGALVTNKVKIGKRVRKYYKLTPEGKDLATQVIEEFKDFMGTMTILLNPKGSTNYEGA